MRSWVTAGMAMVVAVVMAGSPGQAQERHAVLVGINYAHLPETKVLADGRLAPGGRLYGPINVDVPRVEKLLRDRFQFRAANIKVLKEREATKQGILDGLETHLVKRVKPGDFAVFYFSGHGDRAPSGKVAEPFDELICPVDFGRAAGGLAINAVTDKMLKDVMDRLAAVTGRENVLVVLDACHSGTATRSLFDDGGANRRPVNLTAVPKYYPATSYWEMDDTRAIAGTRGVNDKFAFGGAGEDTMKHLLLAACDRNETGKDSKTVGGFFTATLCSLLEAKPEATYQELMTVVEGQVRDMIVRAKTTSQTPQLEGPAELKRRPVFTPFRGLVTEPATPPPPPPPPPPPLVNNQIVAAVGGTPVVPVIPIDGLNQLGPIGLRAALDKPEYREGAEIQITVTADRDCYLRIYNVNPQGRAVQLFPNRYQMNNQVRAGQTVTIPGPGAEFALAVMGDTRAEFGNEIINVLAAEKQWSDLAGVGTRDYVDGIGGRFLNVNTRGPGQTRRALTLAETFVAGASTRSVVVVGRPPVQVFDVSAKLVGFVTRANPGKP